MDPQSRKGLWEAACERTAGSAATHRTGCRGSPAAPSAACSCPGRPVTGAAGRPEVLPPEWQVEGAPPAGQTGLAVEVEARSQNLKRDRQTPPSPTARPPGAAVGPTHGNDRQQQRRACEVGAAGAAGSPLGLFTTGADGPAKATADRALSALSSGSGRRFYPPLNLSEVKLELEVTHLFCVRPLVVTSRGPGVGHRTELPSPGPLATEPAHVAGLHYGLE